MEVNSQLPAPAFCTGNRPGHFAEEKSYVPEIESRFFGRPTHSPLITPNELRHRVLACTVFVACSNLRCVCVLTNSASTVCISQRGLEMSLLIGVQILLRRVHKWRLNFRRRCPVFVLRQYGTCVVTPNRCLEF
jgi:hypothetical protein